MISDREDMPSPKIGLDILLAGCVCERFTFPLLLGFLPYSLQAALRDDRSFRLLFPVQAGGQSRLLLLPLFTLA